MDGERTSGGWWMVEDAARIASRPRSITRHGRRIVLWRDASRTLRAHDARCPHRGVDLGAGRVVRGELECAYHGFRFDGSGACVAMPCEGSTKSAPPSLRLRSLPVREDRGLVWVWFGERLDPLPPLPWPTTLSTRISGSCTRVMEWQVPFARAMEAMLDVHHLPFAHRGLAYGIGPRLDPWRVRIAGGSMHAEGWMRSDRGSPGGGSGQRFALEARPPGIVLLEFSPRLHGIVGCTPIDAHSTAIVVRFEVAVPLVGSLLAWLALGAELALVQPDDERMQRLTLRERNDLSECALVRADATIVEWHRLLRKEREASKEAGSEDDARVG